MKQNFVFLLDLGSSSLKSAVVDLGQSFPNAVVWQSKVDSRGIKHGQIINVDEFTACVLQLVEACRAALDSLPKKAFVLLSSSAFKSFNSYGVTRVLQKDVTAYDLHRVSEIASAIPLEKDEKIIHSIAQNFLLDYQPSDAPPLGMSGTRLEMNSHLIVMRKASIDHVKNTLKNIGMTDVSVQYSGFVASNIMSAADKEMGCCLLDIGAGISDITVFSQNKVCITQTIALGVDDVIQAVSEGFQLPMHLAKEVFLRYGTLDLKPTENTIFEVQSERACYRIERADLQSVIQVVYASILERLAHTLAKLPDFQMGGGIYISGGGSQLDGFEQYVKKNLQVDVVLANNGAMPDETKLSEVVILSAAQACLESRDEPSRSAPRGVVQKLKAFWQVHF